MRRRPETVSAIEDIILRNDRRGVSGLRRYLPDDFCTQAAQYILDHPGPAIICTGFHILSAGAPETDGPPGAYFIGQVLEKLGYSITYVAGMYSGFALRNSVPSEKVVEFPIADETSSQRSAQELLETVHPSVLISIERCGMTRGGRYLNMVGKDISQYNAKLDYLFSDHETTIGIGDGGNEIGMGNLAEQIPSIDTLPDDPAITQVNKLIIASVSNWGGYGLIAALSLLVGRNLLPSVQEEEEVIRGMVDKGAVDGISAQQIYAVDGFPLDENRQALESLL
jgi:hypothetical protein